MEKGCRAPDCGDAVGRIVCDGLCREPIEDCDVDWDLVEEDFEAPANCGAAVARRREDKANAWSKVKAFGGKADMIEAQAEIQCQATMDLSVVLREKREVI